MENTPNQEEPQAELRQEQQPEVVEQAPTEVTIEDMENMSDEKFEEFYEQNVENPEPQVNDNVTPEAQEPRTENQEQQVPPTQDESGSNIPEGIPEDYRVLFEPIKANGTEITPTPAELIKLAQLGSKYYADREQIKPQLKLVKMVEKSGLNNEQLALAFEAANGNKDAIAKLIQNGELDIDSIDETLEKNEFNIDTSKYDITEQEMKLDAIEKELEQSPVYEQVASTIGSLDENSKNEFMQDPDKILALDGHIQSGLYELATKEMARGKTFGEYQDTTWMRNYEQAVTKVMATHNPQQQEPQVANQQQQYQAPQQQQYKQAPNEVPSVIQGQTSGSNPVKNVIDLNMMDIDKVSDEEFEKMFQAQYGQI